MVERGFEKNELNIILQHKVTQLQQKFGYAHFLSFLTLICKFSANPDLKFQNTIVLLNLRKDQDTS